MKPHAAVVLLSLLVATAAPAAGQPPTHQMTIHADRGEHVISRHIYGHFAEHLGRGIYDGFWRQDAAGSYEIREDVVEALRALRIPNLRWPGGCFADYYFWKDGVGPRAERPSIVNVIWGGVTEDNSVGTHEFMELVARLGTEPVIVGNVGSGTVREMAQWWEYVNHPGPSPMADRRRENGRAEPWDVRFWGVGNESWGCGGNMRPEYYADLYRRYATYLHAYPGVRPFRIAAGAAGSDYHWTEVVMREAADLMDGLDVHHYTILGDWETRKGHATDYGQAEWFELVRRGWETDTLVARHAEIMDRYDPEKRVWLIMGEWGTWHEPTDGSPSGFLEQQQTIRDALVAAQALDVFNRNADRVRMANIAQTVNVLQAMILTEGERMLLTPTYHVFEMYTVHHDATLLPVDLDAGRYTFGDEAVPAVTATASRDAEGRLHLTLTNLDPMTPRVIEAVIQGHVASAVSGRILTAEQITAHNTFEAPEVVRPAPFGGARLVGDRLTVDLPPKALVVLRLE